MNKSTTMTQMADQSININSRSLSLVNLGRTDYAETWQLQKQLVDRRAQGKIDDCLIITEHDPVLTMGRGTHRENLLASEKSLAEQGVGLFEIERGGDITFHGPGQLILYPIIDLRHRQRDLHKYLRDLERVVINALGEIGLKAGIKKGLTGIWVNDHKVGAIGVAVSRWISYHGLALNINTDLDYFKLINPCGITEFPVGSISQLAEKPVKIAQMATLLTEHFSSWFGYERSELIDLKELLPETDDSN